METKEVYNISGKLEVKWLPEVGAIVDKWKSYSVTLQEFQTAILDKGLNYAKFWNGSAWIADSSDANGVFSKDIQDFINSEVFPAFSKSGIKYFVTVKPKNALTSLTVKKYAEKAGPNGLRLVETSSLAEAINYLKNKN